MNAKITPEHLGRGAIVYVRQSTLGQVVENTESQRRQYALADSASVMGFSSVLTIDDDLGRSGSGVVVRPGFQKLVASVCTGSAQCFASRLRAWRELNRFSASAVRRSKGKIVIASAAYNARTRLRDDLTAEFKE